jgi:hypothetical protein
MKTRGFFLFICLAFMSWSCTRHTDSLKAYIKNADSVSVTFYTEGQGSTNIIIRDKNSVNKIRDYISGGAISSSSCTETGSIWFYEGPRKKIQVDFGIHPDCSFFSYVMSNQIHTKMMPSEAVEYLTGVEQIATGKL